MTGRRRNHRSARLQDEDALLMRDPNLHNVPLGEVCKLKHSQQQLDRTTKPELHEIIRHLEEKLFETEKRIGEEFLLACKWKSRFINLINLVIFLVIILALIILG